MTTATTETELEAELDHLGARNYQLNVELQEVSSKRRALQTKAITATGKHFDNIKDELVTLQNKIDALYGIIQEIEARKEKVQGHLSQLRGDEKQAEQLARAEEIASEMEQIFKEIETLSTATMLSLNVNSPHVAKLAHTILDKQIELRGLTNELKLPLTDSIAAAQTLSGEKVMLNINQLRARPEVAPPSSAFDYSAFFMQALDQAINRVAIERRRA